MPTWNSKKVLTDEQTRINLAFINKLWGVNGEAVRNELFGQPNQKAVHDLLRTNHNFDIPDEVKIIMVDIDGARPTSFSASIDPAVDEFYYLVLPPKPIKRPGDPDYIAMQTGLEAFFHAANDGWGM
ncbi:MAG: hypothetical protein ACKVQU_09320 [Burkholderiales bacterium]